MVRTAPPFWDRVERGDGCWEWTAARDRHDAGVVWWDGKTRRAAAVAFLLTHGRWAERRITLSCGNPACCRPEHLIEATAQPAAVDPTAVSVPAERRPSPPKPRRGYGVGSMREVRPGVWELRAPTGPQTPFRSKPREVSRTVRGTRAEAQADLVALRAQARSGGPLRVGATLNDLFDAYLAWCAVAGRGPSPRSVAKSYEPKIRLHLRPHLGRHRLTALADGRAINELYQAMLGPDWAGRPITPTMIFEVHRILSAVLRWAVEHDWIAANDDPRRNIATPHP